MQILLHWIKLTAGFDFRPDQGQLMHRMKPAFSFCLCATLMAGVLSVAPLAKAQTTWGYIPTNAFPGLVFTNPTCIVSPPGETNRLFIVEKKGRIVVITNLASPTRTIFMDISSSSSVISASDTTVGGEEGLLGLAFHPGYAVNGFFYVFYTGTATTSAGSNTRHDILSRFQVSASNPNQGNAASEIRYLLQYDEANNHNAGDLHFGPDGYLYVALGDEGGSNGQFGNTQRIDLNYFSAIMRIDVDKTPGNVAPNPHASLPSLTNYYVPADNPWVGATNFNGITVNSNNVRTEFWAVGMRNPWRFSFDPANGECFLGHVGQNSNEWVNIVSKGDNCGWNLFEGTTQRSNSLPSGFNYNSRPLTQYSHTNSRICIIGGNVCRGTRWPALNGSYLYADYGSGEVWALRHNGTNVTQNTILFTRSTDGISGFGIDPSNGDPLYAALRSGNNSIIQRIIATNSVPVFNSVKLSGTNFVAAGTNGPPSANYYVLTSTNLTTPTTNWTRAATNPFDSGGNFNFTNPIGPGRSNLFYMLQLQ
jgi:glucose/arabinose dehydrogenase